MSRAKKNVMHGKADGGMLGTNYQRKPKTIGEVLSSAQGFKKGGRARHKADGGAMGSSARAQRIAGSRFTADDMKRYEALNRPKMDKKGGRIQRKMDGGMMNANNNQMPANNAPNQYSAASQVPRPTQGVQVWSNNTSANPWAHPALAGLRSQQPQQPMNTNNAPNWMQNPNLQQQMNMPVGNKYKKGGRARKADIGGFMGPTPLQSDLLGQGADFWGRQADRRRQMGNAYTDSDELRKAKSDQFLGGFRNKFGSGFKKGGRVKSGVAQRMEDVCRY